MKYYRIHKIIKIWLCIFIGLRNTCRWERYLDIRWTKTTYRYRKSTHSWSKDFTVRWSYVSARFWKWKGRGKLIQKAEIICINFRLFGDYCGVLIPNQRQSNHFESEPCWVDVLSLSSWHTTLFQCSSNVIWTSWTLDGRWNNAVWRLGYDTSVERQLCLLP